MNNQDRRSARGEIAQTADDHAEFILFDGFVADPVFEKVAEDVKGVGGARAVPEEIEEQPGDGGAIAAEMQVGDE